MSLEGFDSLRRESGNLALIHSASLILAGRRGSPGGIVRALASAWTEWTAEIILHAPLEEARRWISPIVGSLEETPEGTLLLSQADSLDWMAHYLMGLPWPLVVKGPPELLPTLEKLRARVGACLDAPSTTAQAD